MGADETEVLLSAVRTKLRGADESTVRIVAAIAGLLVAVAYADRDFSPAESTQLDRELARIQGLDPAGASAIAAILREHMVRFSTAFVPRFTRTLREEGDRELRLEVLGVLVEMAAADGSITVNEVAALRNVTQALGLDQRDYNDLQSQHRDKLSVL